MTSHRISRPKPHLVNDIYCTRGRLGLPLHLAVGVLICVVCISMACSSRKRCQKNRDCPHQMFCDESQQCSQGCKSKRDCGKTERCDRAAGRCVADREERVDAEKNGADGGAADSNGQEQDRPCSTGQKRLCFDGDAALIGKGACKQGQQSCVLGIWGACVGQHTPQTEICNNKDDDCDGEINEGVSDCICKKDEDCSPSRPSCRSGFCVKLCENDRFCQSNQQCRSGYCQSCPDGGNRKKSEECNGKDDDCDGRVDEGIAPRDCYTGPQGTKNVGLCRQGRQSCQVGTWGECEGEVLPRQDASCSGRDTNCDGTPDNREQRCFLHRQCSSQNSCEAGYVCAKPLAVALPTGFCLQRCDGKPSICKRNTDGRTTCQDVGKDSQGKTIFACVQLAKKGETCGAYQPSVRCGAGLGCDIFAGDRRGRGRCVTVGTAQIGERCGPLMSPPVACTGDAFCESFSSHKAYCLKKCSSDTDCPSEFRCMGASQGQGTCWQTCKTKRPVCLYRGFGCNGRVCIPR